MSPGPAVQCVWTVNLELSPGVYTDVRRDVTDDNTLRWTTGSTANGPADRVAQPGIFEFSLRNDARNAAGLLGNYSPGHPNCRSGFTYGIQVQLIATYNGTPHTVWQGRLRTITPDPGLLGPRRTHCTAQDIMADLVDASVRSISPQINQAEDALITAILGGLAPELTTTFSTDLDPGLDVVPFAFDNLGSGVLSVSALQDVVTSALGWCYATPGVLVYENRHSRTLKSSQHTFTDADGIGLEVQSSFDGVVNRFRVTCHPKTVDAAATTVLYAAPSPVEVPPGQTVTNWGTYRDPTNTVKLIGGTDIVDGALTTADYSANSASDGSADDLSASVAIVATGFASTVMFEITNNHATALAYVTPQVRGRGIYDNGPQTVEAFTAEKYGDRPFDLDLPFQNDLTLAQDMADYLLNVYVLRRVLGTYSIPANRSATLMTQALTRQLGDIITISETVTGSTSVLGAIQGIEGHVSDGALTVTWSLVPQSDSPGFIFDDVVHGLFDGASTLGYA